MASCRFCCPSERSTIEAAGGGVVGTLLRQLD
jgi:hypothetical protein